MLHLEKIVDLGEHRFGSTAVCGANFVIGSAALAAAEVELEKVANDRGTASSFHLVVRIDAAEQLLVERSGW